MDAIFWIIAIGAVINSFYKNYKKRQQEEQKKQQAFHKVMSEQDIAPAKEQSFFSSITDTLEEYAKQAEQSFNEMGSLGDHAVEEQSGSMIDESREGMCDDEHVHSVPIQERESSMTEIREAQQKQVVNYESKMTIKQSSFDEVSKVKVAAVRQGAFEEMSKKSSKKHVAGQKSATDKNKLESSAYESKAAFIAKISSEEMRKAVIMSEILKRPKFGVPVRRR